MDNKIWVLHRTSPSHFVITEGTLETGIIQHNRVNSVYVNGEKYHTYDTNLFYSFRAALYDFYMSLCIFKLEFPVSFTFNEKTVETASIRRLKNLIKYLHNCEVLGQILKDAAERIFYYRVIEHLPFTKIAKIIGWSANSTRNQYLQAIDRVTDWGLGIHSDAKALALLEEYIRAENE